MVKVQDALKLMRTPNHKNELVPFNFTYVKEDGSDCVVEKGRILLKSKNQSEGNDLYIPYVKEDGEIRRFFYKSLTQFNGQVVFI